MCKYNKKTRPLGLFTTVTFVLTYINGSSTNLRVLIGLAPTLKTNALIGPKRNSPFMKKNCSALVSS